MHLRDLGLRSPSTPPPPGTELAAVPILEHCHVALKPPQKKNKGTIIPTLGVSVRETELMHVVI